jgi:N-acetylglutamate synthase-like GNAT family acetyltransferase
MSSNQVITFRHNVQPQELIRLDREVAEKRWQMLPILGRYNQSGIWYPNTVAAFVLPETGLNTASGPEQAIGFIANKFDFGNNTYEVGGLAVSEDQRGARIGERLLSELLDGMRTSYGRFRALAFVNTMSASLFYNSGFTDTTDVPSQAFTECRKCPMFQELAVAARCCDNIVEKEVI